MVDATDLKSVLAKSGVWVRLPSSALSKNAILLGKIVRIHGRIAYERSLTKTHENTNDSSSIRQAQSSGNRSLILIRISKRNWKPKFRRVFWEDFRNISGSLHPET